MPNRETHLSIALIILIIYVVILFKMNLSQYSWYGVTIFFGAILPDIIDPWSKENRFNHRKKGHSRRLIKPLWVASVISLILALFFPIFLLLMMFILGYLSHLYADSIKTKAWSKGLPN